MGMALVTQHVMKPDKEDKIDTVPAIDYLRM